MASTKRPNFLFIITDQHRADYLGCAGHPVLKTPNIDSIAANGVRFDRFYVSNPVCMPNRATLMTGRMPSLHGVRCNGIPLSPQENTFVELLRDAGYRTALMGKSHLQNMTDRPPQMTRRSEPREDGFAEARKPYPAADGALEQERPATWEDDEFELSYPFYGFDEVELCTLHGDLVGGAYKRWLRRQAPDADKLVGPKHALSHDYVCPQAWRTAVPEELYPTRYVEEQSLAWLDRYSAEDADDPFFLMMSFPDPHHPFTPPGKYWDMYKPEDMTLPASFARLPNDPPPTLSWMYENRVEGKTERGVGVQFAFVVDERETLEAMALTCGMIAMIDDTVGRVLARLEALDLADDTVVVFTSDHGDFLGDHRLLLKGQVHYQGLVRTPFILSDPAGPTKGAACDALSGMVDVASTILDRAGVVPYNGIQGRSLLPETRNLADHGPGCVLIEDDQQRQMLGFSGSSRLHSLITQRWRLSVYLDADWGELYDLENDSDEFDNLWDSADHAAVKAELLELFVRRQMATVDWSPNPTAIA